MTRSRMRPLGRWAVVVAALVTVGSLGACVAYPRYHDQYGGYNGGHNGGYNNGQNRQQGYNQGGYYQQGYPVQAAGYYYPASQGYYQQGYGGYRPDNSTR